jgi:hypothetical protein
MYSHSFLFQPGIWLGEGTIHVIGSPNPISFYTKWTVQKLENGKIILEQKIEMQGSETIFQNNFCITDLTESSFSIQFSNEYVNRVAGKGIIEPKKIFWEYNAKLTEDNLLQGFENYQLQENGGYSFHAEYISSDHLYGTEIDGNIWVKSI